MTVFPSVRAPTKEEKEETLEDEIHHMGEVCGRLWAGPILTGRFTFAHLSNQFWTGTTMHGFPRILEEKNGILRTLW